MYFFEMPDVGRKNEQNRKEWVIRKLKSINPGTRLLDAGAGEQQYKPYCCHLEYVSQDFGEYNGNGNGKGLQTNTWDVTNLDIISDISSIPVDDKSFDVVLCTEVFEHLPSPHLAIKEFSRILKPGGTLILTAPFCSLTHFSPFHFSTGFNKYYYEKHLLDYGFEICEMTANGNYFEYLAQEINRLDSVAEKYSKQKRTFIDIILKYFIMKKLFKCTKNDLGSAELLNHGYHVVAKRLK